MKTTLSTRSRTRWLLLLLSVTVPATLLFMLPLASVASPAAVQTQSNCPSLENTPSFTIVYGQVMLDQLVAPAGTIVEARSPRDELVGCFEVAEAGYYGAMYIYGEDNTVSPSIPGMRDGETIAFQVDGAAAIVTPTLTWQNDRDLHEAALSAVAVPPAAISDLTIEKVGSDLVLSWSPVTENEQGGAAIIAHYNVYRHSDPYFQLTPAYLIGAASDNSYTDPGAANAVTHYYYLVSSVSSAAYESQRSNWAGKFTVPVLPGWNMLALPLLPLTTTLDAVLGDQLHGTADPATADRVLVWDSAGQSYETAWYCGGPDCDALGPDYANHWLASDYATSTLTLEPDTGFWLQNRSGLTETLVLVGGLAETSRAVTVGQSWQMLGSAFPISQTLDNANLPATGTDSPSTADRVLYWDADAQTYVSAWYCGGPICEGWGEPWADRWLAGDYSPTDIVLLPGHGFWYQNRHDSFVWPNPGNN